MYVYEASLCLVPIEVREGVGSPGIGVTGDCELPVWVLETKSKSYSRTASVLNL